MSQDSPTPEELRSLTRAPQIDQPLLNEQEFDPEEARQPRPISGNPIVKLAIVGGSLLPIFLFAGLFLGSRRGTPNQNAQPTASASPSVSPSPDAQGNQREKLGQTEAQLALEKQRLELERLRQTTSAQKTAQKPVPRSTVRSQPDANPPVAVAPPSYIPPPMPRVVSPPTRVAVAPPEVVQPVVSRSVVRKPPKKRVEHTDPLPPESNLTRSRNPQLQSPIDLANLDQQLSDLAGRELKPKTAIVIAQGETLQVMTTGTKAEGVLQTPIVVDEPIQQKALLKPRNATDVSQNASGERFVVVLSEPLKAQDNTIALPAGTQVVAQVNSVSDNGLIKVDATSAIVNHDRQRTEIALPAGTIQIRGQEGSPLVANRHNDKRSEIASRDVQMVTLNGIRRASEIYTRSDSNLIVNSGSIVTGNRKSGSDVLAGVIQGVSESLIDRATERNERAIDEVQKRPDIYQIKAGTPVEVYINYPVQMPREVSQARVTSHRLSTSVPNMEVPSEVPIPQGSNEAELLKSDSLKKILDDN